MHADVRPLLVAALCAVVIPAQTTWIVDATGGGQFTAIGPAHDAASPGDTILVRPGSYLGFDRNPAKGVRILGDGPGVTVTSPIRLIALPASQHLHLAGLLIDARLNATVSTGLLNCGLALEDCSSFALSEIQVLGPQGIVLGGSDGGVGLGILRCTGVLSGVTARGGNGTAVSISFGTSGGIGCEVGDSRLAVSRCTFRAGDSGVGWYATYPPWASCRCSAQAVVALDECTLTPGQPPAAGGLSLEVVQSHVLLANHTATISGTIWLSNSLGPATIEFEGPVTLASGSLPLTPRAQPGLVGPGTVAPGGTIVWTVHGGAGQIALAVASLGIQPFAYPSLLDSQLFTATLPSSVYLGLVTVGAGGTATLSFAVPNLPWLRNEHVAMQVVGWVSQPTWKASGVALTRIL